MENGKYNTDEVFFVQVKKHSDSSVQDEHGPFTERKAVKVANGMDINMHEDYYTEVIERR